MPTISQAGVERPEAMNAAERIENGLHAAIAAGESPDMPQGLVKAMRHAVFPGGGRIRPRLCLAVAEACGNPDTDVAGAAAGAIELIHCASLVHDDLPCFDGAALRRGKPSVHRAFGERLAVLAGDALIVRAFETMAAGAARMPQRLPAMIACLGEASGTPHGIAAGQAWECEPLPDLDLSAYHRAKTGALFWAATTLGALSAGHAAADWGSLGQCLGEAYQVADDIKDMTATEAEAGKPVGVDQALGRPSAALRFGLHDAISRLDHLVAEAIASVPECVGAPALRDLIGREHRRLVPERVVRRSA